ncbi:hypothetical protein BD626DRAFT_32873 [Schizophyllum amplum]|uniref:SnoaL-like domain-containing protein n=1 Tax=Schizophyllum amplum TaxID=97359 RepID=A0A550CE72_9AGAR|nr:hypothetical protein BD626DRAFT_32873 [Auriculariopsis ampla]
MAPFALTEAYVRSLLEPGVSEPGALATPFVPGGPFLAALDPALRWVIADADGEGIPGVKAEGVFNLAEWAIKVRDPLVARLAGPIGLHTVAVHIAGNVAIAETAGVATQKNGKPYNNKYCWVLFFSPEGIITEIHEYLNTALLERVYAEN